MRAFLKRMLLLPLVVAVGGLGALARAEIWSASFTDLGVQYTLTFDSLSSPNVGTFELSLVTAGYTGPSDAYLDSVNIKAWDGNDISFALASAPGFTGAWVRSEGPITSGGLTTTGCRNGSAGFACVETWIKGLFDVDWGTSLNPYIFTFNVYADSFLLSGPAGAHVGAGYANSYGVGRGYGITSVTIVPEPEIYAMLLAGLALIVLVAVRRRPQHVGGALSPVA